MRSLGELLTEHGPTVPSPAVYHKSRKDNINLLFTEGHFAL